MEAVTPSRSPSDRGWGWTPQKPTTRGLAHGKRTNSFLIKAVDVDENGLENVDNFWQNMQVVDGNSFEEHHRYDIFESTNPTPSKSPEQENIFETHTSNSSAQSSQSSQSSSKTFQSQRSLHDMVEIETSEIFPISMQSPRRSGNNTNIEQEQQTKPPETPQTSNRFDDNKLTAFKTPEKENSIGEAKVRRIDGKEDNETSFEKADNLVQRYLSKKDVKMPEVSPYVSKNPPPPVSPFQSPKSTNPIHSSPISILKPPQKSPSTNQDSTNTKYIEGQSPDTRLKNAETINDLIQYYEKQQNENQNKNQNIDDIIFEQNPNMTYHMNDDYKEKPDFYPKKYDKRNRGDRKSRLDSEYLPQNRKRIDEFEYQDKKKDNFPRFGDKNIDKYKYHSTEKPDSLRKELGEMISKVAQDFSKDNNQNIASYYPKRSLKSKKIHQNDSIDKYQERITFESPIHSNPNHEATNLFHRENGLFDKRIPSSSSSSSETSSDSDDLELKFRPLLENVNHQINTQQDSYSHSKPNLSFLHSRKQKKNRESEHDLDTYQKVKRMQNESPISKNEHENSKVLKNHKNEPRNSEKNKKLKQYDTQNHFQSNENPNSKNDHRNSKSESHSKFINNKLTENENSDEYDEVHNESPKPHFTYLSHGDTNAFQKAKPIQRLPRADFDENEFDENEVISDESDAPPATPIKLPNANNRANTNTNNQRNNITNNMENYGREKTVTFGSKDETSRQTKTSYPSIFSSFSFTPPPQKITLNQNQNQNQNQSFFPQIPQYPKLNSFFTDINKNAENKKSDAIPSNSSIPPTFSTFNNFQSAFSFQSQNQTSVSNLTKSDTELNENKNALHISPNDKADIIENEESEKRTINGFTFTITKKNTPEYQNDTTLEANLENTEKHIEIGEKQRETKNEKFERVYLNVTSQPPSINQNELDAEIIIAQNRTASRLSRLAQHRHSSSSDSSSDDDENDILKRTKSTKNQTTGYITPRSKLSKYKPTGTPTIQTIPVSPAPPIDQTPPSKTSTSTIHSHAHGDENVNQDGKWRMTRKFVNPAKETKNQNIFGHHEVSVNEKSTMKKRKRRSHHDESTTLEDKTEKKNKIVYSDEEKSENENYKKNVSKEEKSRKRKASENKIENEPRKETLITDLSSSAEETEIMRMPMQSPPTPPSPPSGFAKGRTDILNMPLDFLGPPSLPSSPHSPLIDQPNPTPPSPPPSDDYDDDDGESTPSNKATDTHSNIKNSESESNESKNTKSNRSSGTKKSQTSRNKIGSVVTNDAPNNEPPPPSFAFPEADSDTPNTHFTINSDLENSNDTSKEESTTGTATTTPNPKATDTNSAARNGSGSGVRRRGRRTRETTAVVYDPANDDLPIALRRTLRPRTKPLRHWMGEQIIYGVDELGCRSQCGVKIVDAESPDERETTRVRQPRKFSSTSGKNGKAGNSSADASEVVPKRVTPGVPNKDAFVTFRGIERRQTRSNEVEVLPGRAMELKADHGRVVVMVAAGEATIEYPKSKKRWKIRPGAHAYICKGDSATITNRSEEEPLKMFLVLNM
ncbi:hypothetical protein TRFO_35388 [Tritrichomonas foetus]|uniref:Uncharacterized protein n=1 Tax=Tritrichomonas foetus TaxID=1144522 RepID=A0A1J4JGG3_9EUKA|nr:hypothetical protein TRFO_35388 [Tritrichomonas foetus]|eukprot:OHS98234.1 hypothetical protein TRFO_35388 [Tritrichomonas foetus]